VNQNKSLTLKLLAFALGSFAFGFALVPLYDVLCDLTGFGNQKALAERRLSVEQPDDTRTITARRWRKPCPTSLPDRPRAISARPNVSASRRSISQ